MSKILLYQSAYLLEKVEIYIYVLYRN